MTFLGKKQSLIWSVILSAFLKISNIINKSFKMGPIESFQRSLDPFSERESVTKDLLTQLSDLFRPGSVPLKVISKKRVPSSKSQRIISANVKRGTMQNRNAIQGIVSGFSQRKSAQSIVNTLFSKLDDILGQFAASYNEQEDSIIVADLIGGIYRVDFVIVNQSLQNKGFSDNISNVFGAQVIVSTVNREDVKDDTAFKLLIERQFGDQSYQTKAVIFKLLKGEQLTPEQVQTLNEIQEYLHQPSTSNN